MEYESHRGHKRLYLQACILSLGVWVATAGAGLGLPHKDGLLTVDSREFFIGDPIRPVDPNERDWPFHFSDWLGGFIETDPILSEYRMYLVRTGYPGLELIEGFATSEVKETIVDTRPELQIPGFQTLNRSGLYLFYPNDSTADYVAICTGDAETGFNYCSVMVVYPYAEHVALNAKRFFPGSLDELGDTFDDIAHRMVEIAVCLDVTDKSPDSRPSQPNDILVDAPALQECKIDLTS